MLYDAGNFLHILRRKPISIANPKVAASATLAFQFGWRPLIQDLIKMTSFAESVEKRRLEILKSQTGEGLKRQVMLFQDAQTQRGQLSVHSVAGIFANPTFTDSMTIRQWGCVTWKARNLAAGYGVTPTWTDAFRSSFGLNAGMIPIDIWKALPWSWCIDWFAGVSDFMQANYNTIHYEPSMMGVMTNRITTRHWDPYPPTPPFITGPQTVTRNQKLRQGIQPLVNPPTLKLPFMDNFKMSVLGSLTILKILGRP